MPPSKLPKIPISCNQLLFYVCNLCAPTRDPEHPSTHPPEPLAAGSLDGGQSVARRPPTGESAAVADHLESGSLPKTCDCTSAAMHSVLCQASKRAEVARMYEEPKGRSTLEIHGVRPADFTEWVTRLPRWPGEPFTKWVRRTQAQSLTGHHNELTTQTYLGLAAGAPGPVQVFSDVDRRELKAWDPRCAELSGPLQIVANFRPAFELFSLAPLWDRVASEAARYPRKTMRRLPGGLLVHVCWRPCDGFRVGMADHSITVVPGTALVCDGTEGVGIIGFAPTPVAVLVPGVDAQKLANAIARAYFEKCPYKSPGQVGAMRALEEMGG